MVTAELNYNPYLLKTDIKFNGQSPRINSLVEKYQNEMLQTWVRKVPEIFHDEMNGYDFELEFVGTDLDCEELKRSFEEAGVTDKQVHIFHKNTLDGRGSKIAELDDLLTWLSENENRNFDNQSFRMKNEELFDGAYPFIVIQGRALDVSRYDEKEISVENVDKIAELIGTELTNTPILFYLDRETLPSLQRNLRYIQRRKDVLPEQLFFYIHPSLNATKAERIIRDLGVKDPQIVHSATDSKIQRYMELYPFTDYIINAIRVMREATDVITDELEEANRQSRITNSEVHRQLETLDDGIERLNTALGTFERRDNLEIPVAWKEVKEKLLTELDEWRKRKTKINKEDEAFRQAYELDAELHRLYQQFESDLAAQVEETRSDIYTMFREWYQNADFDPDYIPDECTMSGASGDPVPSIASELLELKEEKYVMPKEDLMGLFFRQTTNEEKQPVLETTYYYQNWREHAKKSVIPYTDQLLENWFNSVSIYSESLANAYQEHIQSLIENETNQRNSVAMQLSGDEQKLQNDNNWLAEFVSRLERIERG